MDVASTSAPLADDEGHRELMSMDPWFDEVSIGNQTLRQLIMESELSNLDIFHLLKLREKAVELDTFRSMWWYIFFWVQMFTSCIMVHAMSALVCLICLNRHPYNVCATLGILLQGVLMPLTLGAATSAVIAWTSYNSTPRLPAFYAFVLGVGQTIVYCVMAFSKVLATL